MTLIEVMSRDDISQLEFWIELSSSGESSGQEYKLQLLGPDKLSAEIWGAGANSFLMEQGFCTGVCDNSLGVILSTEQNCNMISNRN